MTTDQETAFGDTANIITGMRFRNNKMIKKILSVLYKCGCRFERWQVGARIDLCQKHYSSYQNRSFEELLNLGLRVEDRRQAK